MSAENVPPYRYTAADVQNYLLQYRSRPLEAVNNLPRWIDKPQAPFDIDFAAPLSKFQIADSPVRDPWSSVQCPGQARCHLFLAQNGKQESSGGD